MNLFDVATVIENSSHWPNEGDSRACGVTIFGGEVCEPPFTAPDPEDSILPTLTVVEGDGDGDTYRFQPFMLEAIFNRRTWCERDDDESWLAEQFRASTEKAVLLALLTAPYTGAETGFYNPGIEVADVVASASAKLRVMHEAWTNVAVPLPEDKYPIVFVSVDALESLYGTHLIHNRASDDELVTVWNEPVILLPDSVSGEIFITGPITVYLSPVENVQGNEIRGNRVEYRAIREAAIDTAPCLIAAHTG